MKQNDDGRTVAAMDVLVPRFGEISGDRNGNGAWIVSKTGLRKADLISIRISGTGPAKIRIHPELRFSAWDSNVCCLRDGHDEYPGRHPLPQAPRQADF
jgi:hypothetical protein